MKYEIPELTALKPAIDAFQDAISKTPQGPIESLGYNEQLSAYEDWEQ